MECYFDYAATSLKKPEEVGNQMYHALIDNRYGNPSRGAHDYALNGYRAIFQARNRLAAFFQVPDASMIGYTMNGTMSLNIALKGLLQPGDHVITTVYEHNSVLRPLYQLEKQGVELSFVGCEQPSGKINYEDFEKQVKENTKMIVTTHASNVIGNVIDNKRIGQICVDHQLLHVVDAAQTAGSLPIHMVDDNIDVLCFTGHKSLHGPQGIGGICFKQEENLQPLLVGGSGVHSQDKEHPKDFPTVLEAGTQNLPGIIGLDAGVAFIEEQGITKLHQSQQALANRFYEGLQGLPGAIFYGDYEATERSGIVAFNLYDIPSADIADRLNEEFGIAMRPGLHCAPLLHDAMGTTHQGILRFSFSHYNTEEEVDYAIESIKTIYKEIEGSRTGE